MTPISDTLQGMFVPCRPTIACDNPPQRHWTTTAKSLIMPDLPSGTVTFLFTDIEGSTALWERNRNAIAVAIERYIALLDAAITARRQVAARA
jgi:class 3 adenylate cyclase